MRTLDLTTLRSFVAVAEAGGVTRAARSLNLTQSAVSMQLKRLEEMLGLTLLDRAGRGVALTAAGEQLLGYARRMVALNDEIYVRLTCASFEGEVVLGVPHDIHYPVIPQVLKRFNAAYPRMRVELLSQNSGVLLEKHRAGVTDIILTTETGIGSEGETLGQAEISWLGAPGGLAWRQRPMPLAMGWNCAFRPLAMRKLEAAGIPWDNAIETESDRSIEAMVSADLAVTAMLREHAPPHLAVVDPGSGLPDLGHSRINLYAGGVKGEPAEALADMIRQGFATLPGIQPAESGATVAA